MILALTSEPEPPSPQPQPVPTALSRRRRERTENRAQETQVVPLSTSQGPGGRERRASWGQRSLARTTG